MAKSIAGKVFPRLGGRIGPWLEAVAEAERRGRGDEPSAGTVRETFEQSVDDARALWTNDPTLKTLANYAHKWIRSVGSMEHGARPGATSHVLWTWASPHTPGYTASSHTVRFQTVMLLSTLGCMLLDGGQPARASRVFYHLATYEIPAWTSPHKQAGCPDVDADTQAGMHALALGLTAGASAQSMATHSQVAAILFYAWSLIHVRSVWKQRALKEASKHRAAAAVLLARRWEKDRGPYHGRAVLRRFMVGTGDYSVKPEYNRLAAEVAALPVELEPTLSATDMQIAVQSDLFPSVVLQRRGPQSLDQVFNELL